MPEVAGLAFADSAFASRKDRLMFWMFVLVTFLGGLTWSTQTLLSIVLSESLAIPAVGSVIGAAAVPMVLAALFGALLIHRIGPKNTATLSLFIIFLGHVSFSVTAEAFVPAMASRIVAALGFGLFVPSTMLFAKSRLGNRNATYLFGIYSSMILVSFAFGPAVFEAYLKRYGSDLFFVVSSGPIILALIIAVLVPSQRSAPAAALSGAQPDQRTFAAGRTAWSAYGLIFGVTLISGFTNSFLAVFMLQSGVMVGYFFGPQSAALILSRLTVMRLIEHFSVRDKMIAAYAFLAVSYLFILLRDDWWCFVLSGVMGGFGASIAYPTLSMWLSSQYSAGEEHARTKAISVFNAAYFLGANVSALLAGVVIAAFDVQTLLVVLVCFGVLFSVCVFVLVPKAPQVLHDGKVRAAPEQTKPVRSTSRTNEGERL